MFSSDKKTRKLLRYLLPIYLCSFSSLAISKGLSTFLQTSFCGFWIQTSWSGLLRMRRDVPVFLRVRMNSEGVSFYKSLRVKFLTSYLSSYVNPILFLFFAFFLSFCCLWNFKKYFWACDRIWVDVLVWIISSIFFQSFPNLKTPRRGPRSTLKKLEMLMFCPSSLC